MATLREIRNRIVGVKSTQKITQAMKMVAVAKLKRSQEKILSARPYANKLGEMLNNLVQDDNPELNPLLQERPIANVLIVVVTSDKGMCGAFNTNIIKKSIELIDTSYAELNKNGKVQILCIGRKSHHYFSKRNYKIFHSYQNIFVGNLNFSTAQSISEKLINSFISEEFDKIELVYNEFKSVAQQTIVVDQFLPFKKEEPSQDKTTKKKSIANFIYEPNPVAIVNTIIPKHLNTHIWKVLLESNAAEEGARMTAMDNANENAKEMISSLNLEFNKARQASITTEILEIISGANALKEA
jgi:F-type H+-transporting ATPase subunit gamma